MSENIFSGFADDLMKNIRTMIDVDTVIGTPITAEDGTIIVPVSKVSFGVGVGGANLAKKKTDASADSSDIYGGGGGAGANVDPAAFLVITRDNVRLINMDPPVSPVDKVIDLLPGMLGKVNGLVTDLAEKRREKKNTAEVDTDAAAEN